MPLIRRFLPFPRQMNQFEKFRKILWRAPINRACFHACDCMEKDLVVVYYA